MGCTDHEWEHCDGVPLPTGHVTPPFDYCFWCGDRVTCMPLCCRAPRG